MATVRVTTNSKGIGQLLKGKPVVDELVRRGKAVQSVAGADDHALNVKIGPNRARVTVVTATPKAMMDEAVNRNLTTAFEAARQ